MYTIEFNAQLKNGVIEIPEEYRDELDETVHVIIQSKRNPNRSTFAEVAVRYPITTSGFTPLTREEIYER